MQVVLFQHACHTTFRTLVSMPASPPCRHTEALRIHVHRLQRVDQAELYCDRVYQRRQAALREARHAELAGALRARRSQRVLAVAASAGGALAGLTLNPGSLSAASGGGGGGGARSLRFGSGSDLGDAVSGGAAAAPAKLQPARGGTEDGADIYLLLVQVRVWPWVGGAPVGMRGSAMTAAGGKGREEQAVQTPVSSVAQLAFQQMCVRFDEAEVTFLSSAPGRAC